MTQVYKKDTIFMFFLLIIFIHELSVNFFYTYCKELMRLLKDSLVCYFFSLFQVFLFFTLSPSSVSLPLTSLSVCLSVCMSVFVCLSVCWSLSFTLSLSIYLSLLSLPIAFFFFLSLSISVYNSVFL